DNAQVSVHNELRSVAPAGSPPIKAGVFIAFRKCWIKRQPHQGPALREQPDLSFCSSDRFLVLGIKIRPQLMASDSGRRLDCQNPLCWHPPGGAHPVDCLTGDTE